jgi:hypothetical protein
MTVIEHYTSLIEHSLRHFRTMSTDEASIAAFTRSHNFIPDFELLGEVIAARPEQGSFLGLDKSRFDSVLGSATPPGVIGPSDQGSPTRNQVSPH